VVIHKLGWAWLGWLSLTRRSRVWIRLCMVRLVWGRLARIVSWRQVSCCKTRSQLLHPPTGSKTSQLLEGATVASRNDLSWDADACGDGTHLRTDLKLQVGVQRPRFLPLRSEAIERPASRLLRRVCETQCRTFLADIEAGYRSWLASSAAAASEAMLSDASTLAEEDSPLCM
jgi:hypothetical protein